MLINLWDTSAARHVSTKFPCHVRGDSLSTAVSGQW